MANSDNTQVRERNVPQNRGGRGGSHETIRKFQWGVFVLAALMSWPFGVLAEGTGLTVFGWPFFALYVVVLVPAVALGYYYYYAKTAIDIEYSNQPPDETSTDEDVVGGD